MPTCTPDERHVLDALIAGTHVVYDVETIQALIARAEKDRGRS